MVLKSLPAGVDIPDLAFEVFLMTLMDPSPEFMLDFKVLPAVPLDGGGRSWAASDRCLERPMTLASCRAEGEPSMALFQLPLWLIQVVKQSIYESMWRTAKGLRRLRMVCEGGTSSERQCGNVLALAC